MKRTQRDEFLIAMFADDPRLVEALREADKEEQETWERWKGAAVIIGTWLGIVGIFTLIVWGIAIGLDKGF